MKYKKTEEEIKIETEEEVIVETKNVKPMTNAVTEARKRKQNMFRK